MRWAGSAWPEADELGARRATTCSEARAPVNAPATVTPITAASTQVWVPRRWLRRGSLVTNRAIDEVLGYPPRRWRGIDARSQMHQSPEQTRCHSAVTKVPIR